MPTTTETAYTATRTAITEGLTEARLLALISPRPSGSDAQTFEEVASIILRRLAEIGTNDPTLSILDAATPVLTLSAQDVIAAAARGALDVITDTSGEPVDPFAPAPTVPVITTEMDAPWGDVRAYRQALFALAPVFGVRVRTVRVDDDDNYVLRIGGREADIRAFRTSVIDSFLTAHVNDLNFTGFSPAERLTYWATLADLMIDRSDLRDLAQEATDRYVAATEALNARYGVVRTITRATPVTEGRVRDLAEQAATTILPPA